MLLWRADDLAHPLAKEVRILALLSEGTRKVLSQCSALSVVVLATLAVSAGCSIRTTKLGPRNIRYALIVLLFRFTNAAFGQQINLPAGDDPRGPVVNPGMTVRVSSAGIEAPDYRFTPSAETVLWEAPWMWLNPGISNHTPVAAYFRKPITLRSVADHAGQTKLGMKR